MEDHMEDHALCGCDVCAGKIDMRGLKEKEAEMIKSLGFFAHYVADNEHKFVNYHTHGFRETWRHDDFQIVFPLSPEIAHGIFWNLAHRVKDGDRFSDGQSADKIIGKEMIIKFKASTEAGRSVLRVLLPDKDGLFPGDDGVSPDFATQDVAEFMEPDLYGLREDNE
jgi:hypothetical protein